MISVKINNNELLITILEETINISNAEKLLEDLKKATSSNSSKDIVIDLMKVRLLDSSAIAMLVKFVQSLTGARKKLSLINAAPSVKDPIKVLNLSKFLNLV